MSVSFTMVAPNQTVGVSFVSNLTGNSYTSGVNGTVSVLAQDVNAAESAGFTPLAQKNVVTLALSTAAGVYVIPGAVNLIPVSTIAAVALIAAPTTIGQATQLVAVSTGNFVITSSGCTILSDKGVACTTLTCNTGTCDLISVGSTLVQITNRSIVSNTSAAITYGITSS